VRDLRALPKTDLHVHFQGSVRPSTLRDLAAKHDCELPPGLDGDRYVWKDFFDFLTQYGIVTRAVRDPEDYHRVAYEICEDHAQQGVAYAEVTLTVLGHAIATGDWTSPVVAALDGFEAGRETFGTSCRLVLDHPRGFPIEYAEHMLDVALRYRDRGVVAIGLGGPEAQPGEPVAEVFRRARAEGLHSVPHAGEATGPESIREALDLLLAERIGHGIRAVEDAALLDELRERRIALEVCPTSNVVLSNVASFDEHPLPRLLEAGVLVTLNSDDPAMFASPLLGEYEVGRRVFGLDDDTLAALARNGVDASFADEATKMDMTTGIDSWLDKEEA
jgi:adenosine deaminase